MNEEKFGDFINNEVGQLNPTMKLTPTQDNDIPFQECTPEIILGKNVETINGKKTILTLNDSKLELFDIFANKTSLGKLKEDYGEWENWIGKKVQLTKTRDTKFNQEMILIEPV